MNDLVFEQDGQAMTDSLIMAEYYGKRPGDVTRAIEQILSDLPEIRGRRTFASTSYVDSQGRTQPKYIINRDGAMLLTNTFKGRKAREKQWKVIQAINVLEAKVRFLEDERTQRAHRVQLESADHTAKRLAQLEAIVAKLAQPADKPLTLDDVMKRLRIKDAPPRLRNVVVSYYIGWLGIDRVPPRIRWCVAFDRYHMDEFLPIARRRSSSRASQLLTAGFAGVSTA